MAEQEESPDRCPVCGGDWQEVTKDFSGAGWWLSCSRTSDCRTIKVIGNVKRFKS